VAVAFGSDWPVMPAEPLATMHTAVNSDNLTLPSGALWGPGASVSPEEALRAHTVGGAVACNLESEVGVLRYAQLLLPLLPPPFPLLPPPYSSSSSSNNISPQLWSLCRQSL